MDQGIKRTPGLVEGLGQSWNRPTVRGPVRRLGTSVLVGQMVREGTGRWQEGGKQTQKEEGIGW